MQSIIQRFLSAPTRNSSLWFECLREIGASLNSWLRRHPKLTHHGESRHTA